MTVALTEKEAQSDTSELLSFIRKSFNEVHTKQFSFSLGSQEIEIMRLRARVTDDSEEMDIKPIEKAAQRTPPDSAILETKNILVEGKSIKATFWDREAISKQGYIIEGPAVITEMDSNTLILPGYYGEIDQMTNILIRPKEHQDRTEKNLKPSPEESKRIVIEDPLITSLISSSLQSIRREMDSLMLRCAKSPAIRDQQDEFNVISNPKGQMLVGQFGSFIPSFLEMWKETIEEGDVFM